MGLKKCAEGGSKYLGNVTHHGGGARCAGGPSAEVVSRRKGLRRPDATGKSQPITNEPRFPHCAKSTGHCWDRPVG